MTIANRPVASDDAAVKMVAASLGIAPAALQWGLHCITDQLSPISRASNTAENQRLPSHLGMRAASWFATLPHAPADLYVDPMIAGRVLARLRGDPEAGVGDLLAAGSGLVHWDVPAERDAAENAAPMSLGVTAALLAATSHGRGQSVRIPRFITDLFAEQAAAHPDRLAIDAIDGCMTFSTLERRTRVLAQRLLEWGVERDSVVAVMAPRDTTLLKALLAIWRAGAAFLLLDPHDPHALSRYKLEAAAARLMVCAPAFVSEWSVAKQPVIILDNALTPEVADGCDLPEVTGHDLAYVVFTSGSTGRPKGVMIDHEGLAEHLATQLAPFYDAVATPETPLRVGGAAPVSFDSFIDQVLPMVALGHTLVLFDEYERVRPDRFLDCGPSAVDVVDCAPSQLTLLVDHGLLERHKPLRLIVCGGESPSQHTWDQLRKSGVPAVSIYGATECTIGSMAADVHEHKLVNLGFPDGSARVYVLDAAGDVVPPGIVGEVYLAGPGVGRGFVGSPDETARLFVPDPFSQRAGARMYRTGDMARMDPSGRLYFCGRRDDQVKIRGFRIELGEVEAALTAVPGIRQAAVIPVPSTGVATHLVAFLVGAPNLSWAKIREHIAQRLPYYMIPARALQIETLPLTRNGKVDRRALAALDAADARQTVVVAQEDGPCGEAQPELWPAMGDDLIAAAHPSLANEDLLSRPEPPANELEVWIRDIWQEVLKRDLIGVLDNFQTIGGHSLAAIEIITRIQAGFPHRFDIRAALATQTIREMAAVLAQASHAL